MESQQVQNYGWSFSDPQSTNYLAPSILQFCSKSSNIKEILDLGCGNGSVTSRLSEAGFKVTGCDVDADGIAIASKRFPNIDFRVIGVNESIPEDLVDRFDLVISSEVVEHLFIPSQLIDFAHKALKPGGRLLLTTPYHGYLKNLTLSLLDKWDKHHTPLWNGGHIKFWSRKTLGKLISERGFVEDQFWGVGRVPYLWKSMVMVCKKINS